MAERVPVEAVEGALAKAREAGLWPARSALFHDLDRLRARLHELHQAFPPDTLHAIAVKANPVIELLREVVAAGGGLEAASWEEVCCALAAGCAPDRVVFDSPAKTREELRLALEVGVVVNADNEAELERIEALGGPRKGRVGIRVNPQIGEGSIAMTSTVGASSKFGVPLSQAPALVNRFGFVDGLHVHTGSQGVGLPLLQAAAASVASVAKSLGLKWLDVGGGIAVRYRNDPEPPTFAEWAAAMPEGLQLITEPGRSIHAPTGFAVTPIEWVKDVDGRPTWFVHLGADLLLRRVYRPDQWDHEFVLLDSAGRVKTGPENATRIAGPLCFSGDLLAKERLMPVAEPGDLLLIRDTGAYTLSMWSRHCSRGLPPTLGYSDQGIRVLHPGEAPEAVVEFWST